MKIARFTSVLCAGVAIACIALAGNARGAGADIKYSGLAGSILKFGPVNNTYAYILGSNTCNIGDSSLSWVSSGTPGLAMNAYRLHNGRLTQIGMGNAKTACCVGNSTNILCGTTCSGSGFGLRPGCMDTYGASFNAGQTRLAPRSFMNPQTGAISTAYPATSGDAIYRRCQVKQADMEPATFPGALYFVEGQYVCTEDAQSHNDLNNCSYARVTLDATFGMTAQGGLTIGTPAIFAWRDHGNGPGIPDPSVTIQLVDVPGEGRFIVGSKITQTGKAAWHYEYAIFNQNSDRAGASFSVPFPLGASVSNLGFHDVDYHSGEVYNNADWTLPSASPNGELRWATPQPYSQNVNGPALRWGTMYNFWFDANPPPVAGHAELGLFKPAVGCQPASVQIAMQVPAVDCAPDLLRNRRVDVGDLLAVISGWGPCQCSLNCPADIVPNGQVDINDILGVVQNWGGCP